jgi:pilus assembly protein Flp/PilA
MRTRRKRTRRSVAQSMVEYAIVAALVAVVAIVAIRTLGTTVQGIFSNINSQVETVKPDPNQGTTTH